MSDIDDVKQQLVDVQSQLAYQEDAVQALNDALSSQQQEILVLRRQLQLLKERQDEHGGEPPVAGSGQEKPPHY